MPQTRPLPRPHDPVAPASPGTLPNTEDSTRRCPPGRCARIDAAPMADVVARCAAREVRTPTQYVARWTEVAVVARERGHLAGQTELSFNAVADVDAARPALEDAVCGAIAAEEACGEEPARERTRELVGALDRPKPKRGSGGRGKRREAVAVRRLSEVRDREITHELRWNRCAELAVSLELTAIEAALLAAVSMFCVTAAFVCWEMRAGLMAMARIKTNASFAAAVASLMRHGLLVPVDGAPRTAWYLGESFLGGLLVGEELDTPVAKLVRGRKRAAERQAGPRRAGQRGSVNNGGTNSGAADAGAEDRPSKASGEATSSDKSEPQEPETESGSVENRTSDPERRNDGGGRDSRAGGNGRKRGRKGGGAVPERAARNGKERVTIARFVADELADDPHREKIEERLRDFFGKLGERRVARSRQRGLAALVRGDLTGLPPRSLADAGVRRGGRFDAADPRQGRCRQCGGLFELPGTGGDRGDGVCRACDLHPRTRAPVNVGSIVDGLTEHLRNRD